MTHLTRKLRVGSILGMALMLTCFLVAMTDRAEAVSMGPYVDVASGSGTLEWDFTGNEYDVDTSSAAVGFALDTSPLGKTIFSYRLNVGLEGQELKDDDGLIRDLGGIYCENIFAFGFVKKTNLRWWGGPLVRFGFYSGETDTYVFSGDRWKDEYDIFQFGIGFVSGVNIKAGRVLILAPSVGVRFMAVDGTVEAVNLDTNFRSPSIDTSGGFTNIFVNFALLF